jgi:tellurite resistance protein TerC
MLTRLANGAIALGAVLICTYLYLGWHDHQERDLFPTSVQNPLEPAFVVTAPQFFQSASAREWLVLLFTCATLFIVDVLVFQRLPDDFKMHLLTVFSWVVIAAIFNFVVWLYRGRESAFDWCTGYMLEWMLSMDNLFVFHLVFSTYKTPANQIHKAVFVGIAGAIAMRMVFFMTVSTLLHLISWIRFPFGAMLIWSGIKTARAEDDEDDIADTKVIKAVKNCLGQRLLEHYDENGAMFVYNASAGWQVTPLIFVVACLEFADILFALDSVSAKIAQIPNEYIAFSSSVLCMYGLRALFFIVKDLVEMFYMLKYGLCMILVFIGVELMLADYIQLSSSQVCILIVTVFVTSIAGSRVRLDLNKISASDADVSNNRLESDADV